MTGSCTSGCSPMRSAMMFMSYTACGSRASSTIQPVWMAKYRSEWSPRMSSGPLTERVTKSSTMGKRVPDCTGICSSEYSKPLALVALNTRPPPVEAP